MSAKRGKQQVVEGVVERLLFGGRWLLAPLYIGLLLGLLVIVMKFIQAFVHLLSQALSAEMSEVTMAVLELLDIALLGNLILIVIFSGYENFVSKINVAQESEDRPSWMGKVDFSGLKIKLIGSLVAISVIELLKDFLVPETIVPEQEIWLIGIHLTFVVSGVLFALMDYIADKRALSDLAADRMEIENKQLEKQLHMSPAEIRDINPTGE